ncbi:MAG: DUF72 domain-containing protein [Polyangiaceae bacterium]
MGRVQVGLPGFHGDIAKYAQRFDMVEVRADTFDAVKPATLKAWRRAVKPAFTFSVVLPRSAGALSDTADARAELARALKAAAVLEARCVVLETPADVRPTRANREKLQALLARLTQPSTQVCWEPRGMWETSEVHATARAMGVLAVVDAAREPAPATPAIYTRIRALGANGVSAKAIARIAEQLRGRRDAWVIVEDRASAARVRKDLGGALTELAPPPAAMVVKPSAGRLRAEDEEQ